MLTNITNCFLIFFSSLISSLFAALLSLGTRSIPQSPTRSPRRKTGHHLLRGSFPIHLACLHANLPCHCNGAICPPFWMDYISRRLGSLGNNGYLACGSKHWILWNKNWRETFLLRHCSCAYFLLLQYERRADKTTNIYLLYSHILWKCCNDCTLVLFFRNIFK